MQDGAVSVSACTHGRGFGFRERNTRPRLPADLIGTARTWHGRRVPVNSIHQTVWFGSSAAPLAGYRSPRARLAVLLLFLLVVFPALNRAAAVAGQCDPLPLDTISYPDAQSIDDYTALQSYMQKNFGTPTQALLKGYIYPTHGFVVLTDNGFVLSNTGEIPGMEGHGAADDLDPMSPNLLFYAPTGAPSRVGFRRGSFTDLIPDFPYRLIGWGYLTDYVPGAPPELEGVTSEAWFVHESGWHLLNGGMKLTPPKGEDSCEKGRLVIEKAPKRSRPFNGIAWHQRAWDLHMWCGQDGVPVITYAEPFNQLPAKTLDLPAGAFFVPLFP